MKRLENISRMSSIESDNNLSVLNEVEPLSTVMLPPKNVFKCKNSQENLYFVKQLPNK